MRQSIVFVDGRKTEKDEGDYFPLWLRRFVTAVFDPLPNAAAWKGSGITIDQITMPNGAKSAACAKAKTKVGTGERATDAFSNVCFDGEGRFQSIGSPAFSMEFHDYRGFGKKQVPRHYVDNPEPGTTLVGEVIQLDDGSKEGKADLFVALPANDDRFRSIPVSSAQLEKLTANSSPVTWPPVSSGNLRGRLAIYISIDNLGQVREAWPQNSDNAGLEDPARDQVRHWKIKPPVDESGNRLQIEGALGFNFETVIGNPLPVLSDEEARALAIRVVEPEFPPEVLKPGVRYRIRIAVDEQGKFTGGAAGDTEIPGTQPMPGGGVFPVMIALEQWQFKPLIRDGKPQYFHAELVFEAK